MTASREDVLAVEAATDLLAKALSRGDISSATDLVTDATMVLPPNRRTAKGTGAVEFWRNLAMGSEGVRMLSTDMESPAEGLMRDAGTLSVRLKANGNQLLFRYMILWKKTGEAWTVHTMMWNREAPAGGRRRGGGDQAQAAGEM